MPGHRTSWQQAGGVDIQGDHRRPSLSPFCGPAFLSSLPTSRPRLSPLHSALVQTHQTPSGQSPHLQEGTPLREPPPSPHLP